MVKMFQEAYGKAPNPKDYGRAIAVFQRHFIITGESAFDRYAKGNVLAMSEAAVRGIALFKGKANCISCHNGPNFTDYGFYNVGLKHNSLLDDAIYQKVLKFDAKRKGVKEWKTLSTDPGRYLVTHDKQDWGKFKTPTLRNLIDTPPYMHDGRYRKLTEVIDHYNRGGDGTPGQDTRIQPLKLSTQQKQDLIEFLLSLKGPLPDIKMQDWVRAVKITNKEEAQGKTLFEGKATCINCHQKNGKGVPSVFPPLANNPHVTAGDGSYVVETILHGLSGELEVEGRVFNATMPPVGIQQALSDAEIAAVATYVRTAWGNRGSNVTPEMVTKHR